MKKVFITSVLLVFSFVLQVASVNAVHVNGYYRSNGTYVQGYERTAPDSSPYNNYSYPGNYNPNTGEITGGNPETYLNNYFNKSSGSINSPTYNYPSLSIPTTPTCPSMSSYDSLSGNCKCYSGYVVGTDFLGKQACVSADSECTDSLGYGARYNSLSEKCECRYGYVFNGSKCESETTYCSNLLGLMSQYNTTSKQCECMAGYEYNGSQCVYKSNTNNLSDTCPANSVLKTDGKCYCNDGYKVSDSKDGCTMIACPVNSILIGDQCVCNNDFVLKNNICITHTEDCQQLYGENVYGDMGTSNNSTCYCNNGYGWNNDKTACIKNEAVLGVKIISTIEKEKKLLEKVDNNLSNKLKGKILLQVESTGEAWYVNPKNSKKYYMADGGEAYNIMRDLGVGITNKDLEKIKGDKTFAKKQSGKIFLQVETNGEAYYIDFNGVAHYLKDGAAAYTIMRELGLGITNNDIRKIDIN